MSRCIRAVSVKLRPSSLLSSARRVARWTAVPADVIWVRLVGWPKRPPRTLLRSIALGLSLVSVVVAGCAQQPIGAAPSVAPLATCDGGIPAVKCNPSLYSPPITAQLTPGPVPSAASGDGPTAVPCGEGFFDASTAKLMSERFGSLECFRFDGSATWIVVGDGESLSTGLASPGGSIVAVESCPAGDTACTDPNAIHSFAGFRVSYPPDPSSGRAHFEASFAGRYLWISVAYCGLFTFDVVSGNWYGHDASVMAALVSGSGSPAVVKTPPTVTGSDALTSGAPPSTGDCQPSAT
jgi:hypothetical protein